MRRYVVMLGAGPQQRGGIASVVSTLLGAGLERRVPVRVIETVAEHGAARKLAKFLFAGACLATMLVCRQVSLVHAHVASGASFWRKSLLLALTRWFGVPTVFHLHGGGFAEFTAQQRGWRQAWIKKTLAASSRVVVLSPRWAGWVQSTQPLAKACVMGNPVELRALESGTREPVVLFLGDVTAAKGCAELITAWAKLRAQLPQWRLVLAGRGDIDAFQRLARSQGIADSVHFAGWLGAEEKLRAMRGASIFVLPSYKEGLSMAILEAMASGLAVVSTDVGGTPDLIQNEVTGLLVPAKDPDELAAALQRLCIDSALRARLAEAARLRVLEEFEAGRAVGRWAKLYEELGVSITPEHVEDWNRV